MIFYATEDAPDAGFPQATDGKRALLQTPLVSPNAVP
jgi:hypothetical protein